MFVTAVCVLLLLNLDELGYDATNLLSCMTLDVENLHSVVHYKSGVSTALQYACDFGSTAKENLKRTTVWSAYYYTSRGLWYPVPERSLAMFEIPSMSQTSVVKASKYEFSVMREWARAHGSSVRQRSYHGKGWNSARLFVPKGNRSWRKNQPFFSVATTDISSVSSITDAEDESYRVRFKQ